MLLSGAVVELCAVLLIAVDTDQQIQCSELYKSGGEAFRPLLSAGSGEAPGGYARAPCRHHMRKNRAHQAAASRSNTKMANALPLFSTQPEDLGLLSSHYRSIERPETAGVEAKSLGGLFREESSQKWLELAQPKAALESEPITNSVWEPLHAPYGASAPLKSEGYWKQPRHQVARV